jgi:hypothetical protein
MKEIKFIPSGSKLEIIAMSEKAELWLKTLKESSKRVKPGSERFVISAFEKLKRETSSKEMEQIKNAPSRAEQSAQKQQEQSNLAVLNSEIIAEATMRWQKIFRETPQWGLSFGEKSGYCGCELYSASCSYSYEGRGANWKEARADAAQNFLDEVNLLY